MDVLVPYDAVLVGGVIAQCSGFSRNGHGLMHVAHGERKGQVEHLTRG